MECFFLAVGSFDEVEIEELIYRKYHDPGYIFTKRVNDFIEFVNKAKYIDEDEKIYEQWISLLPFMNMKYFAFIPYRDYREKVTGGNIDKRSNQEIIDELERIHGRKLL